MVARLGFLRPRDQPARAGGRGGPLRRVICVYVARRLGSFQPRRPGSRLPGSRRRGGRLSLNAELVTLSACETGLGRRVRGEGIIGLPHALLAAGARGVLVSLWRISDRSAADFMERSYSELQMGRPPAQALVHVRRTLIDDGAGASHPSRWAAFVLVGGVDGEPQRAAEPPWRAAG